MFNLFYSRPTGGRGQVVVARFNYLRTALQENLTKAIQFHRQNTQGVRSDHLLTQIISHCTVPLHLDVVKYSVAASTAALNLGMTFKLTSPLKRGQVHTDGPILGRGSREIIIADISDFDLTNIHKNWMDLEPVKIIRHNSTNVHLPHLDGYHSANRGVAVIVVNIPMLLVQYKMWYDANRSYERGKDLNIGQFVNALPMANALKSYLDVAIFNRCLRNVMGDEIPRGRNENSFHLRDMESLIDEVYGEYVDVSKQRRVDFPNLLEGFPLISMKNLRAFAETGLAVRNRQVDWAMVVARIPIISFLVQVNSTMDGERNQIYLNEIGRGLKILESDQTLSGVMDDDTFEETLFALNNQIKSFV